MTNPRSPQFRYIYVDALKVQFNGTEAIVHLGVREDLGATDDIFYEEVALAMTASSAKLIGLMLSSMVESFERVTGTALPIDPAKVSKIQEMLSSAEGKAAELLAERAKAASEASASSPPS